MKRWRMVFLLTLAFAMIILFRGSLAETVTLPKDLTAVEDEAFFGDESLTAIVLPEGLKTIGSKAFAGTGLTAVTLPSSLKTIADDAFDSPEKVSVTAEMGTKAYLWAVANGYIDPHFTFSENDDGTLTVTGYTGQDTKLDIPPVINRKTVTAIGDEAFRNKTSLTRVTIPDTLRRIGTDAFFGCAGISDPTLPFGLREIGARAFKGTGGHAVSLPRTLVSIGEDAFAGYNQFEAWVGSYAEQWLNRLTEQDKTIQCSFVSIAYVMASTKFAFTGDQVTCTADDIDEYVRSIQWQRSFDSIHWTDCAGEGADKPIYSFIASPETAGCSFRVACTDISGTYYSNGFCKVGYLADGIRFTSAYAAGTDISLGWDNTGWEGISYTLYMTGPDEEETVLAENITDNFYDVGGLEPETAYTFHVTASYGGKTVNGNPVTVTTQNYRTGAVHRALLIGQFHFGGLCRELSDSIGDLNLLGDMLQHVNGPKDGAFSVTRKTEQTYAQVHQAILDTFADADEDDVSLFFIASHGVADDSLGEEYFGALICYNPESKELEYIKDTTLASWLSQIPGEVVVILSSCSSGSTIYDPGEGTGSGSSAKLSAMNSAAINAFRGTDQTLSTGGVRLTFDEEGNAVEAPPMLRIGGLRQTKFHVITSSAHKEDTVATENGPVPHSVFTYGLTQGVGLSGGMPCDTNGDMKASMHEIVSYLNSFVDPYVPTQQHVQAYPANSDYTLFLREE